MKVLFAGGGIDWTEWQSELGRQMAENGLNPKDLATEWPADEVEVIVYAPSYTQGDGFFDFTAFPRLRLVQNIWAGVEKIVGNPTLTVPLARMVDPGLTQGMVEYCVGHAMRYHLDLDHWTAAQEGQWNSRVLPLAWQRRVTILGLGALGSSLALALRALGFNVAGWSRRPKGLDGIRCFHGKEGLHEALRETDILILLLPLTDDTHHVLDGTTLAMLPEGACVINAGRGPLIEDDALLAALEQGRVRHATLDVFAQEPLPPDHPYWSHPKVTVTPHIAAVTRATTAAPVVVENLCRLRDGKPLLHLVDRKSGY